ncbi:hypothetical protein HK105_204616 [Polyrhizophydium stewartii]|uniref:Glycosyltransferase family 92 protein n=1 Tax=Polyrhizophydium stewartii TaxID=2732419 RepID=A0ABR4N8T8_9FUNG|nr:hypothetical protein HK105_007907 [Polyrhizophydium stewartii]
MGIMTTRLRLTPRAMLALAVLLLLLWQSAVMLGASTQDGADAGATLAKQVVLSDAEAAVHARARAGPDAAIRVQDAWGAGVAAAAADATVDAEVARPLVPPSGLADIAASASPIRIKAWPRPRNNTYFLVGVTMIRNKARFVPEWIEFHLLQGFDRLVIYDDRSTDGLRELLETYIREGTVEYLRWPQDNMAADKPPLGPRVFDTPYQRSMFDYQLQRLCINRPKDGRHSHGGCQNSAALDTLARYRHRTTWIVHFDIDEFFFKPLAPGTSKPALGDIVTVRDLLLSNQDKYDHIVVPGRIFGTNGFMDGPTPMTGQMPFPLVPDRYRFRRIHGPTRDREPLVRTRLHCEKGFAKAHLPSATIIHFWTFEKNVTVRHHRGFDTVMSMNHYQYRSVFDQNRKAAENSNFNIEYSRPTDQFMNEQPDYEIGYLLPYVRHNLELRMRDGLFAKLPSAEFWKPQRKPYVRDERTRVDMCIAITHTTATVAQLRKTVHTIFHYLNTFDKDITYKAVFVAHERSIVGQDVPEHTHFADFYSLLDAAEYVPASTPLPAMIDLADDLCGSNAEFILHLEDLWETRFRVPGRRDTAAPIVQMPVFKLAMDLMRHDETLLEVWLGDTPQHSSYRSTRTEWLPIPAAAMQARPASSEAQDGSQRNSTGGGSGTNNSNHTLTDPSTVRWYRKHLGDGENTHTVVRLGGTLRLRARQSQIGRWASLQASDGKALTLLAVQQRYGELARDLGLASAHLCFGDPAVERECRLDPDTTGDGATTGIMWRQRIILEQSKKTEALFDRP